MADAMDEDKQVRLPVGFPPDLYEWLRLEAFRRRGKMAAIVREAVAEYRVRVDPQMGLPMGQPEPPGQEG